MFTQKKTKLFEVPSKGTSSTTTMTSAFVKAGQKKTAETRSGNNAKKYSTTGNAFVDQFSFLGSYKAPRPFVDIEKDCEALWAIDPLTTIKFIVYLRTITRKTQLMTGETTSVPQKGGELKHESIMRMIWLSQKDKKAFEKNLDLFIAAGSWQDVIKMLQYDLIYNGWEGRVLDWDLMQSALVTGLSMDSQVNLIKKYLPQIKANSACRTVEAQADNMIAKWICSFLFGTKEGKEARSYKAYRKLKTSGTAHQWQQLISQKKFNLLDFSTIHGRALSLLVKSKFLDNSGLRAKYDAWITKPETKDVKYTGFVHELFEDMPHSLSQLDAARKETINKQFTTLVEKARSGSEQSSLIVVRDTSGSMGSIATGTKLSANNVAKALALYFSEFLKGKFANSWIEFNSSPAKMHTWAGSTVLEKWYNDRSSVIGGTDFQSVLRLFCDIKRQGVPESEFPTGILCISDGEFNPAYCCNQTNVEAGKQLLRNAGFSEDYVNNFIMVFWNLQTRHYGPNTGKKFETFGTDVPNVFYMSGYSAACINFLTGKVRNAEELFQEAMSQEILQLIKMK